MKKHALIVTAFARFIKSFLTNDILILQSMGYEVHCAVNINHVGADCMERYFQDMHVVFHQIDFSSNKLFSRQTFRSYSQMKELFDSIDFDVIHCHTPIASAIARVACRVQRKRGAIVIYTTHGFYFHKHSSKKTWIVFRTIEDLMSRYSDAIITINKEDFDNAKKMHCKNIYYIPGVGVDIQRFTTEKADKTEYRKKLKIKEDAFLILAIGELSQRKNHQIIIKALAECEILNSVFVICGNAMTSANTTDEIIQLSKELGVDVKLMGLREDIPQICKCADVGVMPSTREGLGLSGIEMLAAGLPVVASNVHGIVDYIKNGKNGFLCNPSDYHEFARAISTLTSKDKREEMMQFCIDSVQKYDKKYSKSKMQDIYSELLIKR